MKDFSIEQLLEEVDNIDKPEKKTKKIKKKINSEAEKQQTTSTELLKPLQTNIEEPEDRKTPANIQKIGLQALLKSKFHSKRSNTRDLSKESYPPISVNIQTTNNQNAPRQFVAPLTPLMPNSNQAPIYRLTNIPILLEAEPSVDLAAYKVCPVQTFNRNSTIRKLRKDYNPEEEKLHAIHTQSNRRYQSPMSIDYDENNNLTNPTKSRFAGNIDFSQDPQNLPLVFNKHVSARNQQKPRPRIQTDRLFLPKITDGSPKYYSTLETLNESKSPVKDLHKRL